jgi:SCP-2 sterol transfer family
VSDRSGTGVGPECCDGCALTACAGTGDDALVSLVVGTPDATTEFFDGLARRGYEPLLRKLSGTVRIEVVDGKRIERKYLSVDKGRIMVSGRGSRNQNVIRVDRAVFGRIAQGELNPVAAALRGELAVEGDWRMLVLVQRLFPSPPRTKPSRRAAGYAKRSS